MYNAYNTESQKVERVENINPKIHVHRITHLPFDIAEEVEEEKTVKTVKTSKKK